MSEPIEMVKGQDKKTVHSHIRALILEEQGWWRVSQLTPEQQADMAKRPGEPWRGYGDMTVDEVISYASILDDNRRAEALAYEQATKKRKGVLDALGGTVAPESTETPQDAPADAPAGDDAAGIVPKNDVPAAMGQGRLANKSGRSKKG